MEAGRSQQPHGRAAILAARWSAVRRATTALAAGLSPEDALVQSMPDASPTKWHLAHTTWFFEAFVLAHAEPRAAPFDPRYGYLFNSYYDAIGPRHPRLERGLLSRPALGEVLRYRAHVDARIGDLLGRPCADDLLDAVELGVAHEEQHQELILTDVKHAFFSQPLRPAYAPGCAPAGAMAAPLRFLERDPGVREIGASAAEFAFDNERPRHRVLLAAHQIASRPVTCGEWLEFMEAGGYARPAHWLADGWAAAQRNRWGAPLYWFEDGGRWWQFTLGGIRRVDEAEPVAHVSYYEADAYARFAGARLPSEAEWEVVAQGAPQEGTFANAARFHPAVTPGGEGPLGLFGDVWEWTQSGYAPYPGFRPAAGAAGEYNGKFMVNQLVLRGGSCASPRGHVRASYRNFFYPDARWQFSGVRLARDA
jgi:ergothioneine biosynthesis protein EgtB